MFPRSTSATVAPSSRARRAAVTPAGPPPITTTSNTIRPLSSRSARRNQPQRGVLGPHGLVDNRDQLPSQPVEVRLLAQPGRERRERLRRIVLPPVEAAVYKVLYALAQRVEERGDRERGDHHSERGLVSCQGAQGRLREDYGAEVDQA